jgi:hypothetical protein
MSDKPDASAVSAKERIDPRPTESEKHSAQLILNYLSSSSDHSAYALAYQLRPIIRAAVEAEQRRCEMEANDAVFAALSDEVPDHFDGEGRRDGYTFSAMARIATKVVLAIRGENGSGCESVGGGDE